MTARHRARQQTLWALAFLAPSAIILLAFSIYPMLSSLWTSFHRWNLISPMEWVGLDNYSQVMQSPETARAFANTVGFLIGYVPLVYFGGLLLAVLLNRRLAGRAFFRSVYFLPVVASWVVVALIWKWILNPADGVVNELLGVIGLPQPGWWSDPVWAMPSIVLASAWKDLGLVMVIMLAGLQAVPESVLEAASLDGAGPWRRFWGVTFPLISPTSVLAITLSLISGFQVFDQAYVMSYGTAASQATSTVVLEIFDLTFRYGRAGEGTALSWIFFVAILAVTLTQFAVQRRWVHVD